MEQKHDLRDLMEKMVADKHIMEMLVCTLINIEDITKVKSEDLQYNRDVHKLKYNDAELSLIEKKINEKYPQGHKPLATTVIPFGFYLGEMIIKKIPGAKWNVSDEDNKNGDIFDISVEFKNPKGYSMRAKPFMRAKKYWINREDRMTTFLRMLCFNTEITMDREYWSRRADQDGWITFAWQDMFRMFEANADSLDAAMKDMSNAKGIFHKGTYGDGK